MWKVNSTDKNGNSGAARALEGAGRALVVTALGLGLSFASAGAALAQGETKETASDGQAKSATDAKGKAGAATDKSAPVRVSREARRKARKKYQDGSECMRKYQYACASSAFKAAYEFDPRPNYLYNLGVVHRNMDDLDEAREYFLKYLEIAPTGPLAKTARGFASTLKTRIDAAKKRTTAVEGWQAEVETYKRAAQDAEERARRTEAAAAERTRAAEETVAQSNRTVEAMRAQRDQMEALVRSNRGWGKRTIGWSLMALGGLAAGSAMFAGLDARSAHNELDGLGEGDNWNQSREWLYARAKASNSRLLWLSIASGALLAGGVAVYYLGDRESRRALGGLRQDVVLSPSLSGDAAGVIVSGRF